MQRFLLLTAIFGLMLTPLQAWAQLPRFNPGEPLRAEDLNAIVDQLRNVDGGRPAETITVNCDGGNTIRQALRQANAGDTIQITGTCREAVTITLGGLILDGQGSTTVDGQGQTPITVDTARRVTLRNLVVRNGVRGLQIQRGAVVTVENVTAENNTEHGINVADNAVARVVNSTAQRNTLEGIRAISGGFILLNGTINSMRNRRSGLRATIGGIIQIADATNLPANVTSMLNGRPLNGNPVTGSTGVSLAEGSTLVMSSGTLTTQDNTGRGIDVDDRSSLRLFGGTVMVTGNTQGGVRAQRGSHVGFLASADNTINVQISENQASGVDVNQNASADFGNGVQIRDNIGTGISLSQQAQLRMSDIIVRANQGAGGGINLFNGCTAQLNNVQILDHVNGSGLTIDLQSSVNATNVTIMNNATSDATPRIFSPGINVNNNSALILSGTSERHALVHDNRGAGGGINISNGFTASLNNVDITDHPNGRGINVDDSSVSLQNTMVPNLHASLGARIILNTGNNIPSINCGGNNSGVLIRGGTCS